MNLRLYEWSLSIVYPMQFVSSLNMVLGRSGHVKVVSFAEMSLAQETRVSPGSVLRDDIAEL